jgi:hypothetical protein
MTGSHNIHRPIIIFLFVAFPVHRSHVSATQLVSPVVASFRGAALSLPYEDSMQGSAFEFASGVANSPHHCVAIAINPEPRTDGWLLNVRYGKLKLFGCTNGDRQASVVIVHPALPVIRRIRRSIDAAPGIIVACQSLRRPMILDLPKI